ncbi:membrane protein insertase YidC [Pseudonocardia petroleophila]|uniref:Membrane protein insertase YidC n=1 Tax=Pseudonocardia petroleophila TaxID=37331 RepID=A0A7G7MMF9_9PSEU|nr:membrane protein insertase YidC [Pseudonocardia petroleophila]QNG53970.1 membrane protein insertase YidC [Pseudonocardia petroleophila]
MLNFIYYPVSFILWVWHKVFGAVLGADNGIAWALSVVFLVFTLRAILYKPFVSQVRSMRKMQEFQPEIAKLRKKYGNDRQKQAEEMQKLQKEHGVNPVAGCLPVLVQVPVFIGLFQVLRNFTPLNSNGTPRTENYFFGQEEVFSFIRADFLGAKLGAIVVNGPEAMLAEGTSMTSMLIVMIPLMIMAGIFTHITARHSVARQTAAQGDNPQTAIMNKLMLYVFPIGVVVGAPFLPLAVLLYWVANNLWTLGQQYVVYKRIDVEETAKREKAVVDRTARAPKPGQKPVRPETAAVEAPEKTPGAKPVLRKKSPAGSSNGSSANGSSGNGTSTNGSAANGSATNGAAANGTPAADSTTDSSAPNGSPAGGATSAGAAARRAGGGSRPPARRKGKRR